MASSTTMYVQYMGPTSQDQKETPPSHLQHTLVQTNKDHLLTAQHTPPPPRFKIHPHTCGSLGRRSKWREQGAIMTQELKHRHSEMKPPRSDPMKTLKRTDDGLKKSRCCLAQHVWSLQHQRLFLK